MAVRARFLQLAGPGKTVRAGRRVGGVGVGVGEFVLPETWSEGEEEEEQEEERSDVAKNERASERDGERGASKRI